MASHTNFDLEPFADAGLTLGTLERLIDRHERRTLPRCELLWRYYRNPMLLPEGDVEARGSALARWRPTGWSARGRRYRLAQEAGLPARLLGSAGTAQGRSGVEHSGWSCRDDRDARLGQVRRKEIVVENDIAWRVHTMIDFMFGRPVVIASGAPDAARRRLIERALDAVWEASGGVGLFNDAALLGHVHGHVDLIVRAGVVGSGGGEEAGASDVEEVARRAAELVRIEAVDPSRGVALTDPHDYRRLRAYVLRWCREGDVSAAAGGDVGGVGAGAGGGLDPSAPGILRRILDRWSSGGSAMASEMEGIGAGSSGGGVGGGVGAGVGAVVVTEILDGRTRRVFEQRVLERGVLGAPVLVEESASLVRADRGVEQGPPVAHIQNLSQPLAYEGLSEVEPLIPLQDELNTRLSDRASRVTLQSFKMLLAKGFSDLPSMAVAPGVVWKTDNPDARIEAVGGDAASPSEDRHIEEVREALDKLSGVPPLAGGVVRARIGNLSSANALRVTLMGLLSKTARKRITYGRGIAEASRLALEALDGLGVLRTSEGERVVRVEWPDPLPRDEREVLDAALKKIELGVSRERVLSELGYGRGEGVE